MSQLDQRSRENRDDRHTGRAARPRPTLVAPARMMPERMPPAPMSWAPRPVSANAICAVMALLDVLVLVATATVAFLVWLTNDPYSTVTEYALITALGVLLALNLFNLARLYDSALLHRPHLTLKRVAICWCAVAAALIALSFFTKTSDDYSRFWALMWFACALVGLCAARWLVLARTARWAAEGRLRRKVAIVGTGVFARRLAQRFSSDPKSGVAVVGLFADRENQGQAWKPPAGYAGDVDQLIQLARLDAVDTVIVADESAPGDRLNTLFLRLREVPVDIRYCPGPMALELGRCEVSHYAGIAMLNVVDRPLAEWRYVVKAIEDRVVASAILVMIAPVLLAIAVLIKLDSKGPILFRQKRYGYNNQLVEVWKFRTMYHDLADQKAEQLTQRNDPRVTRVGEFLRRWSLDELPQFFNVLRGDMSIVGPRPHAVSAKAGGLLYQQAVPHYAARHRVKPGITGWAQINGWRGTTDTVRQIEKRVEHDMYYIENWSLWLDLKIIALTVTRGFSAQNAY